MPKPKATTKKRPAKKATKPAKKAAKPVKKTATKPAKKTATKPAKRAGTPAKKAARPAKKAATKLNGRSTASKRNGRKPATRRNSEPGALFEAFHGTPSTKTTNIRQETEYRDELEELGKLVYFDILTPNEDEVRINVSGPVKVSAEPAGRQLYLVGGNQAIDLDDLELGEEESLKDHVFLGVAQHICYFTRKGFHDFEPVNYDHEFGEDGGTQPLLQYDRLNRRLYLTGGSYRVMPEGIVN